MPSRSGPGARRAGRLSLFRPLFGLEWGELVSSRSAWIFLIAMGPLVGHAFSTAVRAYAEASGAAGSPAALAQGLSPLDGILVPTFGADDLALMLLYPFVAIRLVSEEKSSGAGALLWQSPARVPGRLAVKVAVLFLGWAIAMAPVLIAILLWRGYGGHIHGPELANLAAGHFLRFLFATSIALAAAAVCDGAASAAIVALAFTLGTWALDFVGAGRGGFAGAAARYTPAAALRAFERGELPAATVAVFAAISAGALAVAAVWLVPSLTRRRRAAIAAGSVAAALLLAAAAAGLRGSRDLSEDRRNSFSPEDETALASISAPVRITAVLAPEDPRLFDLERGVVSKLRRVLPDLTVRYASDSRSGLFESHGSLDSPAPELPGARYGEVWYEVGGRREMLRSTTGPIVLETLYRLAGVAAPQRKASPPYPGYPLRAKPAGAPAIFYVAWPLAAGLAFLFVTRGRWRPK